MNIVTGLVIIISVAIASFSALIITDKVHISNISSDISQIKNLESQLQQVSAKIDVLYGKPPQPVETNQIIIPQETGDYDKYCNIRYDCVQPYSVVVHVGDSVTWTSQDNNNGHSISSTPSYEQYHCGVGGGLISIILQPHQSSSIKFDKAGQYDYCVSGYNAGDVHGTVFVK